MKRTTFIAALLTFILAAGTLVHASEPNLTIVNAANDTIVLDDGLTSIGLIVSEASTLVAGKKSEQPKVNTPLYIITAMHNNEFVALRCLDSNHRDEAISKPTALKWTNKQCRNIDIVVVGPQIKQVNLVDKDYCFVSKLSAKSLGNGSTCFHFYMNPENGNKQTKKDDPNYILYSDFYFEFVSPDGTVQYTSVRYGITDVE